MWLDAGVNRVYDRQVNRYIIMEKRHIAKWVDRKLRYMDRSMISIYKYRWMLEIYTCI